MTFESPVTPTVATATPQQDSIVLRVISLTDSSERRASMRRQLDAVKGLDWDFFDARESLPDDLPTDPALSRRLLRRDLTPGELGCFASHVTLWRWFVEQPQHQILVVLEDDLLIDPAFFGALDRFCAATAGHDFIRLYAKAPTYARPIGFVMGRHLVRYRGIAFGTQGYVLRRQGALDYLRSIDRVVRPIDDEMDRFWVHKIPNIGVHPFPIMEIGFATTIGQQRRSFTRNGKGDWLRWKGARATDSVRRRLANLRMTVSSLGRRS